MVRLINRHFWLWALTAILVAPIHAETAGGLPLKGYRLLAGPFDHAKDFSEGLAAVKVNHKWGFIDTHGKMVIEPQFNLGQAQFNSNFSDGLVAINLHDGTSFGTDGNDPMNAKWGFADKQGHIVINLKFDHYYYDPLSFSEGMAAVRGGIDGRNYGYIDKSGKFAIEAKFEKALDFHDGLAQVQVDSMWGLIDKKGKFVIEPIYDFVNQFSEGLAVVRLKGKSFFIDRSGIRVAGTDLEGLTSLSEGLASFEHDGKVGFVDRSGKVVIEPQFQSASLFGGGSFSEGLCLVRFGGNSSKTATGSFFSSKFGYINKKGSIVINPKFGFSGDFNDGIAAVEYDGKHGYIDKSGTFVIRPQFSGAGDFKDGIALVTISGTQQRFFVKKLRPNSL